MMRRNSILYICDTIQNSHTGGDPLRQYSLLQYEHFINCNRNNIWVPMTISLHYISKSITIYSTIKYLTWFIQSFPAIFPHYINFVLPCITSFPVILHAEFPNKLHTFNICLLNSCLLNLPQHCGTNHKPVAICLHVRGRWHSMMSRHRIVSTHRKHIVIASEFNIRELIKPWGRVDLEVMTQV